MDLIQPLAAVVLVLALLAGTLAVLRRRGVARFELRKPSSARHLQVMERVALGPSHALHLVRMGDRCLLIATAPSSCQLLESSVASGDLR